MNIGMPVIIQPFLNKHLDSIISLIVGIQQKEFNIKITEKEQPDLQNIEEFYQTGYGNFWTALHSNRVVGTISLKDIGNQQAALRKMFVDKQFRGKDQGVASQLLKVALDWAALKKIKEIFLGTTPEFLAAHRFYEKNSFTEINQDMLPANFPVMVVDTKFYRFKMQN
ncbi:GNAT family N-acetyltransferase [bacterium]|nr:GNAT family N-acetyltransferase [bacterium]